MTVPVTVPVTVTATVTAENTAGYVWCEVDITHQAIFVHQSEVVGRRILHTFDRIRFEIEPNPRFPNKLQGVRVVWVGREIARQSSSPITGERQ